MSVAVVPRPWYWVAKGDPAAKIIPTNVDSACVALVSTKTDQKENVQRFFSRRKTFQCR